MSLTPELQPQDARIGASAQAEPVQQLSLLNLSAPAVPQSRAVGKPRTRGKRDLLAANATATGPIDKLHRLDRNFTQNVLDFSQFGEDEQLCRDLVVYISYALQTPDLLNIGQLEPNHFGRTMRYDKANLFRKHTNPVDKQAPDKAFVWDSVLENALFRLSSQALAFTRPLPSHSRTLQAFRLESVQILRNLTLYTDPRNRDKRYYRFEYNPDIIGNLSKSFATFNLETYNALRQGKINLQRLYLYLEGERTKLRLYNARNDHQANTVEIDFNTLSHLTGKEGVSDVRKRKFKMKQLVDILNEVTGWQFEYRFVATTPEQRFPYTLSITFHDLASLSEQERILQRRKIFSETLERNLLELYRSLAPELGEVNDYDFQSWKFTPKDIGAKYQAYLDAQLFAFEKPSDPFELANQQHFQQIFHYAPVLPRKTGS